MIKKNWSFIVFFAAVQVIFFGCLSGLHSQNLGPHPNGQGWKLMNSPAIRIIYPDGMEPQAQRISSIVNYIRDNSYRSVGNKQIKLDMVLQNRTTIPNGYVGMAPLRSELYCTPPQSNLLVGSIDWLDILAVHEFRHVQQTANTRNGLTKWISWLTGQLGWSMFSVLSVPNWYMEGDAVITETALTESGRGRAPFFMREYRALSYANIQYNYQKMRNGSYKSLLPDHYRLGYMMLSHARKEKGNDIIATVLKEGSAYKGIFYPFSNAMKRNTGYSTTKLYESALAEQKKKWDALVKNTPKSKHNPLTQLPSVTVTDYRFPRFTKDGSVVTNKSSYKKTNHICSIKNGRIRKLSNIGYSFDDYINIGNDVVAWTEASRDARRENLNYSDIILYDLATEKKRRFMKHTRYFSPAVSDAGDVLAAIHITYDQKNSIHILGFNDGKIIQKIENPENYFLSRLTWAGNNRLVSIAKQNGKMALVLIDIPSQKIQVITPWSAHTLEGLSCKNDQIYFGASYSGIDNIFRCSLKETGKIFQITSAAIGVYEPDVSADGKQLVFTSFTHMGQQLETMDLGDEQGIEIQFTEPSEMAYFSDAKFPEEGGNILNKIPINKYESKPYNKLFRGMRLHSWSISPSFTTPSLKINANNILNDLSLTAGGGINRNENNSNYYELDMQVGRFFMESSLQAGMRSRQSQFKNAPGDIDTVKFNESYAGFRTGIPLAWIRGNFATHLRVDIGYTYRSLSNFKGEPGVLQNRNLNTLAYDIRFSTLRRTASQNLGSRLGMSARFEFVHAPGTFNERVMAESKAYLPGPGKNDFIMIRTGMQSEPLRNPYQFTDVFEYPRGFTGILNDRFSMISANYSLPLFYPDKGVAGITYFKRIRANLFYDTGTAMLGTVSRNYTSTGFECIFDNVHMNILPLSFGFRQAFMLQGVNEGDSNRSFTFFMATEL